MISWREKTYAVLPALAVRGQELRRSLRLVTMAWMWGVVWQTTLSGDQMRAFAQMIGFDNFAFGLMGAIPFLATFAQLPSAILVERIGFRKYTCLDTFLVSRAIWLAIAAVPFVIWPGKTGSSAAVVLVLTLFAGHHVLNNAAAPLWWTWMGDLIPRRIRGRYFARRSQITTVIMIAAIFLISFVVQAFSDPTLKGHENAADQPRLMLVLSLILGGGAIFGMIDVITHRRVRDIADTYSDRKPPRSFDFHLARPSEWTFVSAVRYGLAWPAVIWKELLQEPMSHPLFRTYVGFSFVIVFSGSIGGWFYIKHASEVLGISTFGINMLFMVVSPLSIIVTAKFWGKLIDHWGRRTSLFVATIITMTSALPWFFAGRGLVPMDFLADGMNDAVGWVVEAFGGAQGFTWIAAADHPLIWPYLMLATGATLGGFGWSGVGLAQSAVILGLVDLAKEKKNKYVAVSSLLINVGGAVGGLVGGVLAQSLKGIELQFWPIKWNNYLLLFAISMVARFGALAILRSMPDPQARPLKDLPRAFVARLASVLGRRP